MSDRDLIAKILGRDRRALHVFYQTYTPKLRRFIGRKVGSPQDAEEVLQDTLFAFLESLRDFHGDAKLQTYLFSICHHKVVDYYRRKRLKHLVFSQLPQLEALVSPLLSPEDTLDHTLLREKISRVLSKLLPMHKEVLVLKYLDDTSVGDIAKKLAITFKSAESRLFRARRAFVELFLSI